MANDPAQKRLGEILVEQGTVTEENLKKALVEQSKRGGMLGETLLSLGFVKEEDIVIALATQFNFPYLPIDNFEINPQAIKSVPIELVQKYLFIPIDRIKNILTVVMADPANEAAIKNIEETTGCRLQPFVATVTEIKKALKRHYKLTFSDETAGIHVSKISFQQGKGRKAPSDKSTAKE